MKRAAVIFIILFFCIGISHNYAQTGNSNIIVNVDMGAEKISRHIYGHFSEHLGSCIYGGIWVGEDSPIPNTRGIRNDVVKALKEMNIPNLRWPGGCFADEYHWMDGIGPKSERPSMINTHWGGVTEDNSLVRMNSWICVNYLAVNPIFQPTLAAVRFRKWRSGWNM